MSSHNRGDVKGSIKIITRYFGTIQKLLKEKDRSVLEQGEFKPARIAFQVEEYAWVISHTLDHVDIVEIALSASSPFDVANLNCRVVTTTTALLSIATGGSPMTAFLQGNFKIIGDKQILRDYAPVLKEAASLLQRDLRRSSANLEVEILSKLFTVSIVDITYNHTATSGGSSFHTVSDLTSVYSETTANGSDLNSGVAFYVIEVCDIKFNRTWQVRQRYSQFVKLHDALTLQKYNLPSLPDRTAFFRTQAALVESRKTTLQEYLRELLKIIDSKNAFMREFLKLSRDAHAKHRSRDQDDQTEEFQDISNLRQQFATMKDRSLDDPNQNKSSPGKIKTSSGTLSKLYEVWTHAYARPVTWNKALTSHTVHVLQELNRTRKLLSTFMNNSSSDSNLSPTGSNNTLLLRLSSALTSFFIFLLAIQACTYKSSQEIDEMRPVTVPLNDTMSVLGVLEFSFQFVSHYAFTNIMPLLFSLSLSVVILSPSTRYILLRHVLVLVLIQTVVQVSYELFQSPDKMFTTSGDSPEDEKNNQNPSVISIFTLIVPLVMKSYVQILSKLLQGYFAYMVSFIDVLVNGVISMRFSIAFYSNLLTSFLFVVSSYVMLLSSLRRLVIIYILGFSLIFLYIGLKIVCVLFQLPSAQQDVLYNFVESIVAPFIVYHIRNLRSVFIKFAQYAGARSDVVSENWAASLTGLQDNCPPSDSSYVIRTIEENLNEAFVLLPSTDDLDTNDELTNQSEGNTNEAVTSSSTKSNDSNNHVRISISDAFEEFSIEPVASASIGQVHHAVISTKTLKRLAFKVTLKSPVSNLQSGSPSLADAFELQRASLKDSFTHSVFSAHQHTFSSAYSNNHSSSSSVHSGNASGEMNGHGYSSINGNSEDKVAVVVKVQHQNIASIMRADMRVIKVLTRVASWLDKRWKPMRQLVDSWDESLKEELDFHTESVNLSEVGAAMKSSQLGCVMPVAIPGLTFRNMFVMSCLHGYKVTDKLALSCLQVDRVALLNRIAHGAAYQLLVAGVFNADPHPGNLMFCLAKLHKPSAISNPGTRSLDREYDRHRDGSAIWDRYTIAPGLLDFGMTYRMPPARRRLYCKLLLALSEADLKSASAALRDLGYKTTQTERVPERDAEFFAYLFRDASSGRQSNKKETKAYQKRREQERKRDEELGVREKGGRNIDSLPEDFLYVTRVIGLIRGLSAELECECEILTILALHAKAGLAD